MYYLKKCAVEDCNRSGSVALEQGDVVCNIHKDRQARVEVRLKKENKEEDEQ